MQNWVTSSQSSVRAAAGIATAASMNMARPATEMAKERTEGNQSDRLEETQRPRKRERERAIEERISWIVAEMLARGGGRTWLSAEITKML